MSDAATWAGVIIAAGSLIVSVITLLKSAKLQQRIVVIEEQRDREERLSSLQAQLRPELRETGNGSYRLYLANLGRAEARNVQVRLDGGPLAEHHAAVRGDSLPSLVGPGAEVSCLLGISHDCAPPFEVEVRWDDDSGKDRLYRTTLTF